jgi:hypothetical protein
VHLLTAAKKGRKQTAQISKERRRVDNIPPLYTPEFYAHLDEIEKGRFYTQAEADEILESFWGKNWRKIARRKQRRLP